MINQGIRTIGVGFIISAWFFASAKISLATEFACIGLGFFIAGFAWPLTERMNSGAVQLLKLGATRLWQTVYQMYHRNRQPKEKD